MQPEAVAGLEIGDRGNGQRDAAAGDADFDLGTSEIEAAGLGEGGRSCGQQNAGQQTERSTVGVQVKRADHGVYPQAGKSDHSMMLDALDRV
jgi:hypothetical protein